jgi:hypothetical protein
MTAIKRSHQPRATMAFLSIAGCLPTALQHFALNLFTSKGSVVLTNIEGPSRRYPGRLAPDGLICWVPQAGKLGVAGLHLLRWPDPAGAVRGHRPGAGPDRLMQLTYDAFEELELATQHVKRRSQQVRRRARAGHGTPS